MKKQVLIIALSVVAIVFSAFTGKGVKSALNVNVDESKVVWLGKKVSGEHTGNINLLTGNLQFEGDALTGGSFEIDMKSITNTDLEDAEYNQKLVGHLKSDDFFGVERFPKAKFIISNVDHQSKNKYQVKGDITIKGITKSIEFPAQVNIAGSKATISASITIDRSDFGVKYGSGTFFDNLGDKLIYDDFTLNVSLVASK